MWPEQVKLIRRIETAARLFILKSRQLGISTITGLYALWLMLTQPRAKILIISQDEDHAIEFLERIRDIYENLPPLEGVTYPRITFTTFEARAPNRSRIQVLSAGSDVGRSYTPDLAIVDEAAFGNHRHHFAKILAGLLPGLEKKKRSKLLVISTSQNGTHFNTLCRRILDGEGAKGHELAFLSIWADPNRTEEWAAEEMKAYSDAIAFYEEYPRSPEDCFRSRQGRVFPMFGPRHVQDLQFSWRWRYGIGYDHGFIHPAMALLYVYDQFNDFLYILDEVYCTQQDITIVSGQIRDKLVEWKDQGAPERPQMRIADGAIFAEDGRKSVASTLIAVTGMSWTKAWKYDMMGSLELVRLRLSQNRMAIHPRCVNAIRQVTELLWKETKTGAERPVDVQDEAPDILRYICAALEKGYAEADSEPESTIDRLDRLGRLRESARLGLERGESVNAWQAG